MTDFGLDDRSQYHAAHAAAPLCMWRRWSKVVKYLQYVGLGFAALFFSPTHADRDGNYSAVDHTNLEIVTSVLGLERLTHYSPNRNALGFAWAQHFGMEASYYELGDSKFVKSHGSKSDNVGGRGNLKLAFDLSTPLSENARLYSRVGMYVWELDVNYNRATNELDASRGGNSPMVGIGAVYGTDPLRVGIELEQVNAVSFDDTRDQHRMLFNVFSRY